MKSLAEVLQQKSPEYFLRYNNIKYMASTGFQQYATMVGYLTNHGEQHYKNLETNLTLLLPEQIKNEMPAEEIFVLLCAMHFHDIGLLSEKYPDESWISVRNDHVQRSYDYLHDHYEDWGLNQHEAYSIKYICLGHTGNYLNSLPKETIIHHTKVRVQFLAAVLRIADELDLDYTRVSRVVLQLKHIPESSLKHWKKHDAISGILINSYSWSIEIHAIPDSEETKNIINELVEQKLQRELDYVRTIFETYGLFYRQIAVKYTSFDGSATQPTPISVSKEKPDEANTNKDITLEFLNFELLITELNPLQSYHVQVLASPAGEASEKVFVSPQLIDLANPTKFLPQTYGEILFEQFFTGSIRHRLYESIAKLHSRQGLRISLRIDPPELARLSWELLYDNERRQFLGLQKRISIVRHMIVPEPSISLQGLLPVRVLIAVSSPENLPKLNFHDEVSKIQEKLLPLSKSGLVEVDLLINTSRLNLREKLFMSYHVLHFVGHGQFLENKGWIALEKEEGEADLVDAQILSILLKDTSVRLVVLNACKGAEASSYNAFVGTAQQLVGSGISAVIAMQRSISDTDAIVFAEDFYQRLAEKKSLDECVGRAREILMLHSGIDKLSWSSPVLFMRTTNGYIL